MISVLRCIGVSILLQAVAIQAQTTESVSRTGFGVCLDLTFMIDVSCSVSTEDMARGIDFAITVVDNLNSQMTNDRDTTLRVAVGIFVDQVHKIFYLNEYTENKASIRAALEDAKNYLKPEAMKCKTLTHYAINALNNEYFTEINGDRENARYSNVAVVITDARTSSRKWVENGHLERYLQDAEVAGNDIYTVLVKNNRGKDPLDEGLLTGEDNSKLFDIREGNDEEEALRLASFLSFDNACPPSDEPTEDCGDVIFALDVSCSITSGDRDRSIYVASNVFTKVYAETRNFGIGTSLVVFDNSTRVSFLKDSLSPTLDDISTLILETSVTSVACRTKTETMFQVVSEKGLDTSVGKPINLVLFYDGMTSPFHTRDNTLTAANAFKNKPDTELLLVKLKNDRGKDGNEEFNEIPSSPDHLFPLDGSFLNEDNKDSVVQEVADKIIAGLKCPVENVE